MILNHMHLYKEKSVNIYIAHYIGNKDMKIKSKLSVITAALSVLITLTFPAKATELLKAEPISKAQLHSQAKLDLAQMIDTTSIELKSINKDTKALLAAKPVTKKQKAKTFIANNNLLAD